MGISFGESTYLSVLKEDKNFDSEKKIFYYAKDNPRFSFGNVTYDNFKEKHATAGWIGRKFIALPAAIWSGMVKTIFHLAKAILIGIPKAFSDNGKFLKTMLFYVLRDFQESSGWLVTLVHDQYGQFHVQESNFQKVCYECFSTDRLLDIINAENSANEFIRKISKIEEFDYKSVMKLKKICNGKVGEYPFLLPKFNPFKKEEPQFEIDEKFLSEDKTLDLLMAAYKKGIILHFSSLQKPFFDDLSTVEKNWSKAGINGKNIEEIQKSFNISAAFIRKCLHEGPVDVELLNKQLTALAIKYYRAKDFHAVKPSITFETPNTIKLYSFCGEIGNLKDLITKLDTTGIKIKIFGAGFRISKKCYSELEWKDYISKFTHTTFFKAQIEDCTKESLKDNDIWQLTPPSSLWFPTWDEIKQYISANKTKSQHKSVKKDTL